jgi:hypothetical protein
MPERLLLLFLLGDQKVSPPVFLHCVQPPTLANYANLSLSVTTTEPAQMDAWDETDKTYL